MTKEEEFDEKQLMGGRKRRKPTKGHRKPSRRPQSRRTQTRRRTLGMRRRRLSRRFRGGNMRDTLGGV